jgi:hypothetical protein
MRIQLRMLILLFSSVTFKTPAPKIFFFSLKFLCSLLFEGTFTTLFKDLKVKKSHKTVYIYIFLFFSLSIDGYGSGARARPGSVQIRCGSGSGSRRTKNKLILCMNRDQDEYLFGPVFKEMLLKIMPKMKYFWIFFVRNPDNYLINYSIFVIMHAYTGVN